MKATIKDVAHSAGVSTATVSHVFNNTRYVSSEIVDRVKKAADELGYIPNNLAKSLRSNESKKIGLLVPNISNYFSVDIISDINEVLSERGTRSYLDIPMKMYPQKRNKWTSSSRNRWMAS